MRIKDLMFKFGLERKTKDSCIYFQKHPSKLFWRKENQLNNSGWFIVLLPRFLPRLKEMIPPRQHRNLFTGSQLMKELSWRFGLGPKTTLTRCISMYVPDSWDPQMFGETSLCFICHSSSGRNSQNNEVCHASISHLTVLSKHSQNIF